MLPPSAVIVTLVFEVIWISFPLSTSLPLFDWIVMELPAVSITMLFS